jgi:hypothetical protein
MNRKPTRWSMYKVLAGCLVALVMAGCGPVPEFEEGSTESIAAELVAEWGPGEYTTFLEAEECEELEDGLEFIERRAETVPDTPQWREEQGARAAIAIRAEQLGC